MLGQQPEPRSLRPRVPRSSPACLLGSTQSSACPSLSKSTGRRRDGAGPPLQGLERKDSFPSTCHFPLGLPILGFWKSQTEPSRLAAVHAGGTPTEPWGCLRLLLIHPFPSIHASQLMARSWSPVDTQSEAKLQSPSYGRPRHHAACLSQTVTKQPCCGLVRARWFLQFCDFALYMS